MIVGRPSGRTTRSWTLRVRRRSVWSEHTGDVRDLLVDTLEASGYTVLSAENGSAAIEVISEHGRPIDVLITDVMLPKMNGVDLARQLRSSQPDLLVLYISGNPADVLSGSAVLEPGTEVLRKPFAVDTLAVRIRGMLDHRRRVSRRRALRGC